MRAAKCRQARTRSAPPAVAPAVALLCLAALLAPAACTAPWRSLARAGGGKGREGAAFVPGASAVGGLLHSAGCVGTRDLGQCMRRHGALARPVRGRHTAAARLLGMADGAGPASKWEYPATVTVRRGRLAASESPWRVAAFNTIVASSTLVLEVADVLLRLVLLAARALRLVLSAVGLRAATTGLLRQLARGSAGAWGPIPGPRKRVVIVGASFGGLACARMLRRDFDVTIVDQHDWFEYTPGILRLFVKPQHLDCLSASLHDVAVRVSFRSPCPRSSRARLSCSPAAGPGHLR